MSIRRTPRHGSSSGSSDALADIALNSLGLILIILLIYVLLFNDTTRRAIHAAQSSERTIEQLEADVTQLEQAVEETEAQLAAAPTPEAFEALAQAADQLREEVATLTDGNSTLTEQNSALAERNGDLQSQIEQLDRQQSQATARATAAETSRDEAKRTLARLNDEVKNLKSQLQQVSTEATSNKSRVTALSRQVATLQTRIDELSASQGVSGLWRFRINVKELVDSNEKSENVDWLIDYFVWLDIRGTSVTGMLFGVNEIRTSDGHGHSSSHGRIRGTLSVAGRLDVEILFSKPSGGSEHLRVTRRGDKFGGRLESGRHYASFRNYVGPTTGERLTESVFAK